MYCSNQLYIGESTDDSVSFSRLFYVVERLLIRGVVGEYHPHRTSIIRGSNCSKPLLPRGVPDLRV